MGRKKVRLSSKLGINYKSRNQVWKKTISYWNKIFKLFQFIACKYFLFNSFFCSTLRSFRVWLILWNNESGRKEMKGSAVLVSCQDDGVFEESSKWVWKDAGGWEIYKWGWEIFEASNSDFLLSPREFSDCESSTLVTFSFVRSLVSSFTLTQSRRLKRGYPPILSSERWLRRKRTTTTTIKVPATAIILSESNLLPLVIMVGDPRVGKTSFLLR